MTQEKKTIYLIPPKWVTEERDDMRYALVPCTAFDSLKMARIYVEALSYTPEIFKAEVEPELAEIIMMRGEWMLKPEEYKQRFGNSKREEAVDKVIARVLREDADTARRRLSPDVVKDRIAAIMDVAETCAPPCEEIADDGEER